jgi:hypothetical protein
MFYKARVAGAEQLHLALTTDTLFVRRLRQIETSYVEDMNEVDTRRDMTLGEVVRKPCGTRKSSEGVA